MCLYCVWSWSGRRFVNQHRLHMSQRFFLKKNPKGSAIFGAGFLLTCLWGKHICIHRIDCDPRYDFWVKTATDSCVLPTGPESMRWFLGRNRKWQLCSRIYRLVKMVLKKSDLKIINCLSLYRSPITIVTRFGTAALHSDLIWCHNVSFSGWNKNDWVTAIYGRR